MKFAMPNVLILLFGLLTFVPTVQGYPLDGDGYTGIARLEGYRLAQEGAVRGHRLPPGALLKTSEVDLRLLDHLDLTLPEPDPILTEQVRDFLGEGAEQYGFAVLDLSDLAHPRYAEYRGREPGNPGSVGKLMVALGIFQALADIYPDDIEARLQVLRTAPVTADRFIRTDHHKVPFWDAEKKRFHHRPLRIGDTASLWTYLDWMLSASSNAAASMVIKQLILLVQFDRDYPVPPEVSEEFFNSTPRKELSAILSVGLHDPVIRNGLEFNRLRQGGFFTHQGKILVPGTNSRADARELMHFLLLLEQGRIVDPFSSREIKRLLYMTQRRIRYASSPALSGAAVYFKSGSLYRCKEEPDFTCKKYHGNVENRMNSVAIVEAPAKEGHLYYLTVVLSNVLRENSAVAHQTFATRIHRLIESFHPVMRSVPETSDRKRPDRPVPQ